MGRKPNQIVLEFFDRGAKLEDASNRYQHTCKSCGEKFPKGRIDSLINHILKKCPAVSAADRQRVQMTAIPGAQVANSSAIHGLPVDLPFASKPGMSGLEGLEALAEVSRQHLDYGQRIPASEIGSDGMNVHAYANSHANGYTPDDFLVNDDRPDQQEDNSIQGGDFDAYLRRGREDNNMFAGNAPATANMTPSQPNMAVQPFSAASDASPHTTAAPNGNMVPTPQQIAASAASAAMEMMMPNAGLAMETETNTRGSPDGNRIAHMQVRGPAATWPNSFDPLLQENGNPPASSPEVPDRPSPYLRPIAMNPTSPPANMMSDFSLSQKPAKQKVRGRFADSRRKEVQEVRKRGACIRCRMLKKPCSAGDPCTTCGGVETARLWRTPCIRKRLPDTFDLFVANLHSVRAFHAVGQVRSLANFEIMSGRIEATHFPDTSVFVTFSALQAQKSQASGIDPAIIGDGFVSGEEMLDVAILDSDTDDIPAKLEIYMQKVLPTFFESETSSFIRPTLQRAYSMSLDKPDEDRVLSKVLQLWICTHILSSPPATLHLFHNPSHAPSSHLTEPPFAEAGHTGESSGRQPLHTSASAGSYDLITKQLLGAAEKRAGALSKFIMNELERRFLLRQQANNFETFLSSIILLLSAERMCWHFRKWEHDIESDPNSPEREEGQQVSNNTNGTHSDSRPPEISASSPTAQNPAPLVNRATWPLDKHPRDYWRQGENFSDVLCMLLRMRSIPPKIYPRREDGVLTLVVDENADPAARAWFEEVGLTPLKLQERKEAEFDANDWGCWELKLAAKLFGTSF